MPATARGFSEGEPWQPPPSCGLATCCESSRCHRVHSVLDPIYDDGLLVLQSAGLAHLLSIPFLRMVERCPKEVRIGFVSAGRSESRWNDGPGTRCEGQQGPDLDALALCRIRGRLRIHEGTVGSPLCPVVCTVEDLEQQRLVPRHAREVVPAQIRIVCDVYGRPRCGPSGTPAR